MAGNAKLISLVTPFISYGGSFCQQLYRTGVADHDIATSYAELTTDAIGSLLGLRSFPSVG
jgi:hypothetical protein